MEKLSNPLKYFFGIDLKVQVCSPVEIVNGKPNLKYVLNLNDKSKENGKQLYNKKETFIKNFNDQDASDKIKMFIILLMNVIRKLKKMRN